MSTKNSGRFAIIPARAVEDRRLGPAAFRVLCCLGTYGDRDGWCWPSSSTMAERLGIRRQAVSRQFKALARLGYIEVQRQKRKDGGDTSNRYRILFDRALFQVRNDLEGVQQEVAGGQPDIAGGATSEVAPILKNAPKERKHMVEGCAWFDRFWEAFPSRNPHSNPKQPAREKFAAALERGVPAEEIVRGAERYAAYVVSEKVKPRYIARAITFLNEERWEQYADSMASEEAMHAARVKQELETLAGHYSSEELAALAKTRETSGAA
jgi:DNA-binding transcriptional ArsR family regulator